MIKHYIQLMYLISLFIFGFIIDTNAKTNYDTLHTGHDIIAKYECGKQGYQAISKDGYGGYSYGKWQISTQRRNNLPSTFDFFLIYLKENNLKYYNKLIKAGGYHAAYFGSSRFIKTWKLIANEQAFKTAYDSFLLHKEIIPVYIRMDKSGNKSFDKLTSWASENDAIQAAMKSTIIQHGQGGAYKIFQNVCASNNKMTKEVFLKKLYLYRINKYPKYKVRYHAEYNDLKNYLQSDKSKIEKRIVKITKAKNPNIWDKLVKLFS